MRVSIDILYTLYSWSHFDTMVTGPGRFYCVRKAKKKTLHGPLRVLHVSIGVVRLYYIVKIYNILQSGPKNIKSGRQIQIVQFCLNR